MREGTAIRLGQYAEDQEAASCTPSKRVSASRRRIAVALGALMPSPAVHGLQNEAQRRALGDESGAEAEEHSRRQQDRVNERIHTLKSVALLR